MSGQYFENQPVIDDKKYTVNFTLNQRSFTLQASRGVFSKKELDTGTNILLKILLQETLSGSLLDLGCGYGPLGCVMASFHPTLTITLADINHRAVADALHNARKLGLNLQGVVSDGFKELPRMFDWIAFNPPIRAGKTSIYDLYRQTKEHLHPHGGLYLVIRKDKGALSHVTYLETLFSKVTLMTREKGYHVYKATV